MEKYWDKLLHGDYSSFIPELKNQLENDKDNYELWYLLFLAENKNYNGFDSNKVVDIEALEKAKELAPSKKKILMDAEYQLYSNIKNLGNFNSYIRYYQFEKYEDVINRLIVELDDNKAAVNTTKISNALDVIFSNVKNAKDLNIQIIILNALYIKTGDEAFKDLFNEKIKHKSYQYSNLGLTSILETSNELKSCLTYDRVYNTNTEDEERAIRQEKLQALMDKKEKETLAALEAKQNNNGNNNSVNNNVNKSKSEENVNPDIALLRAKSNEEKAKEANAIEDANYYLIAGIIISLFCCGPIGWIVLIVGYSKGVKGSKNCLIALILLIIFEVVASTVVYILRERGIISFNFEV